MTNEEYDKLIKKYEIKDNIVNNITISFIMGGIAGLIAQVLTDYFINI